MSMEPVDPAQVAMLVQGDEVYGIGTIEKLYAEGWPELTFVCLGKGPLYDWLHNRKAKVELIEGLVRFSEKKSLPTLARMPLVFRQARRDAFRIHERLAGRGIRIVHAHWRPQQIMAGYLRRLGYRSVWQINNNMNPQRLRGWGKRLNHRLAKWGADLLLPASDFIAANWLGCGVPIKTIRNAATPIFAGPNELPLDGPIRALVAGRLDESKGHHLAIEAVAIARRNGSDVTLDVYGGPLENNTYADRLRQQISDSGISTAVRLMGFCDDLRRRHQDYHVGLQCRIDPEPCSLWVCETLVDGLPLVASATGGTPELVADGETGLLFGSGDAEDLAAKLLRLLQDPPRLADMRKRAFARGQQYFTLERFIAHTLDAYATLKR